MTQIGLGPTDKPRRVTVGDLRITLLDGGELWLDGGAMFGIIPKPLWSGKVETDASNRIPLSMTCFLLESAGKRVLVETGAGAIGKYPEKERGIFRFADYWIQDSLHAIGIEPASIDYVILTHLHFDHAGGGTRSDGKGGYVPSFPNARYVVQRGEWEDAVNGHAVMTGTYRQENLAPLERAGLLSLVSGDAEIVPGISVTPLPGHTRWQQGVKFTSADRHAILPADLMPTSAHVGLRYNMAYDLLPHENMISKGRLLQEAADKEVMVFLGQDPAHAVWNVRRQNGDRYTLESAPCERED